MKASEFLGLKDDLEDLLVEENITPSTADASDVVAWLFKNDLLDMDRVVEYMSENEESK